MAEEKKEEEPEPKKRKKINAATMGAKLGGWKSSKCDGDCPNCRNVLC